MGACFQTMSVQADKTEKEVREIFEKVQDDDRFENGHSYSGGFGMARGLDFRQRTFATVSEADDWLADNAQKWEAALAVKVEASDGKPARWRIGAWCSS